MSESRALREVRAGVLNRRYVYLVESPSLQYIASFRVAHAIWRRRIEMILSKYDDANVFHASTLIAMFKAESGMYRSINLLNVPIPIQEQLQNSLKKLLFTMKVFLLDLRAWGLLHRIDFDWFVWLANGEIDYDQIITSMLTSNRLTDEQKFIVASRHCMEGYLRTVPLDSLTETVTSVTFDENPALFYWIRRLSGRLDEIPRNADERFKPIDALMAGKCVYDNSDIAAFEYFWHRMGGGDSEWAAGALRSWMGDVLDLDARSYRIATKLFSTIAWVQARRSMLFEIFFTIMLKRSTYSSRLYWHLVKIR